MSQFTLRRVDPISLAKVFAVVQASIGLIIGGCISIFALLAGMVGSSALPEGSGAPGWLGPMIGVGAVIALPVLYGVMGFVSGLIGSFIYNFFAGVVGGIVLEFEREVVPQ